MEFITLIGDITDFPQADAIVNAAHPSLEGGGGVDGAVHRKAGPQLLQACKSLPVIEEDPNGSYGRTNVRCRTGESRITPAFDLPNKHVIHTPGPVYADYKPAEAAALLKGCYQHSLRNAAAYDCKSVAFPAISTGIFGYPLQDATIVAIQSLMEMGKKEPQNFAKMTVYFVCFDIANWMVYDAVLQGFARKHKGGWNSLTGASF